ncbi:DUF2490 domain-containing protein [Qipengyuania sp. MTN3-11]|uniref:DUF2490 domain-containing protein n=1 Tax=Qipengyuania sp. MTN3-11 TaxID=3056557 RepID=UPI0036F225AD
MSNRILAFAIGFAGLGASLQPTGAAAATSDDELWIETSVNGEIAPETGFKFELETRRRDGPDEYIVGAEVNTAVANGIALGGGMEIHDEDGFTEVRPYQQVTIGIGKFDLRSRIEERFYDDSDQMALRLRQRVRFRTDIGAGFGGFASGELLYQLRDRLNGGPSRIDQWRANIGATREIAPGLDLTAGYLFIIRPRDNGATSHTHVGQLSLSYDL